MAYFLKRQSDGAGDSGPMSDLYFPVYDEEGKIVNYTVEHNSRPKVGGVMQVGSPYARSYHYQDYWQTTFVTEILEESENRVVFKTTNSVYEWENK